MPDTLSPFVQTEEQRTLYWKSFDSQRWGFLGWGMNRMQKALKDQIKPVLDALDRTGSISAGMGVLESIPKQPMERAFQDLYGKAGAYFASQVFQSFKSHAPDMQRKEEESGFMRFMREWIQINGAMRVQAITGTTRRRLRVFLEQAVEDGLGIEETARLLSDQQGIVGMQRARLISRTEIISASNRGSLHGAQQTNLNLNKEWLSTRDSRTRRIPEDKTDHFTIDGQTVGLKEPFLVPHVERGQEQLMFPGDPSGSPEAVIMCFTGDTKVSFDSCKKSIRSRYSGKLITIKTARGHELTGTPNHPVMTDRGFIRLDKVDHSTNLVCCPLDRNITGDLDVNNVPFTFKQFHNAFSPISSSSVGVRGINVNLYGRSPDGEIDIVNINSLLGVSIVSPAFKFILKHLLKIPYLAKCFLFLFGALNPYSLPMRIRQIGSSLMGGLNLVMPLLFRHLLPFKRFGFGSASYVNPVINQSSTNNITGNPKIFGNSIFAHPRSIHLNNFVNVDVGSISPAAVSPLPKTLEDKGFADSKSFSNIFPGHSRFIHIDNPVSVEVKFAHNKPVYTLETNEGIYNSGGIIATNCRCTIAYQRK